MISPIDHLTLHLFRVSLVRLGDVRLGDVCHLRSLVAEIRVAGRVFFISFWLLLFYCGYLIEFIIYHVVQTECIFQHSEAFDIEGFLNVTWSKTHGVEQLDTTTSTRSSTQPRSTSQICIRPVRSVKARRVKARPHLAGGRASSSCETRSMCCTCRG